MGRLAGIENPHLPRSKDLVGQKKRLLRLRIKNEESGLRPTLYFRLAFTVYLPSRLFNVPATIQNLSPRPMNYTLPDTSLSNRCRAVFRPIQYLGNKLRALDEIVTAADEICGRSARIGDLFSGTSVVSQAFANAGHLVSAVDAQRYSHVFSTALLGVGRGYRQSCSNLIKTDSDILAHAPDFFAPWTKLVEIEDRAVAQGDTDTLRSLYQELPLSWKDPENPWYADVVSPSSNYAYDRAPLLACVYAGYYFGIRQALELDRLVQIIHSWYRSGHISGWQQNALLTATMTAASAAVHSAGKHFAQPLGVGASGNQTFLDKRLLVDRRVCITTAFADAASAIDLSALSADSGHSSHNTTAETFASQYATDFDLFYLDPPYTAQQYSRFYHILETIVEYKFPYLMHDGRVTKGLYPTERYKSSFCSKKKAPLAFQEIVHAAAAKGTSLLISYSQSAAGSDGNARMISKERLLDECHQAFGRSAVHLSPLKHRYRQFNSTNLANTLRNDSEILISCKAR